MPQRYIKIPEPVTLKDPVTGDQLKPEASPENVISFKDILHKLMHNPMWNETYANIRAADAINRAYSSAEKNGKVVVLAEEDWKKLESAAQNPKTLLIGPGGVAHVQAGYGFHPVMTPQIIPLLEPIMNASTEAPKEE